MGCYRRNEGVVVVVASSSRGAVVWDGSRKGI